MLRFCECRMSSGSSLSLPINGVHRRTEKRSVGGEKFHPVNNRIDHEQGPGVFALLRAYATYTRALPRGEAPPPPPSHPAGLAVLLSPDEGRGTKDERCLVLSIIPTLTEYTACGRPSLMIGTPLALCPQDAQRLREAPMQRQDGKGKHKVQPRIRRASQ